MGSKKVYVNFSTIYNERKLELQCEFWIFKEWWSIQNSIMKNDELNIIIMKLLTSFLMIQAFRPLEKSKKKKKKLISLVNSETKFFS